MTHRTATSTITFAHPFRLSGFAEPLPAGTYKIETHEEMIDGLSFPAYRRVETLLFLPPPPGQANLIQVAAIDPADLEEAQRRDGETSGGPA
ncbi:hypothetical protein [Azospirillum sp. SYSU D00513]|uniref:hypothetical protein n=1 Tax=Azospirillum sp. SYSU D00513 TaxID=2812561 RepID=UPI001A96B25D|nr:hypothetical protein [Azospirillum sp. SYSU D00513]